MESLIAAGGRRIEHERSGALRLGSLVDVRPGLDLYHLLSMAGGMAVTEMWGQYPKLAVVFHSMILVVFAGFFVAVLPKSRFTAVILGLAVLVTASTLILNTRSAMRNGWRGTGDNDNDDDEQEGEASLPLPEIVRGTEIAVDEAESDSALESPDNVGDPN